MNLRLVAAASLCCSVAWGDFSYEQTSKMTGGAMAGMMRVAGAFSKAAREPQKITIMVKGDRMANVMSNRVSIIDLNAETFTDVDLEKKTYATITFAQMSEAMRKMAEKMGQAKDGQANVQFKADVKNTGETRVIQGMNTKETIVTLAMEASDKQSGNAGAMNFTMDMWMAPDVPGYGEVRAFYTRMAQKMAWTPGGGMMGPMMAQHAKGMAELTKEMSKLEGIPVLQITRIGGSGSGPGMPSEAELAQMQAQAEQAQAQQQAQQPTVQEAAGSAAAGAALGRMGKIGGLAGGLGGFGRRKKTEQPQQEAPPPQQQAQAPVPRSGAGQGSLMEMTTELTGFSSSVDASKFDVPAGFKQIEHDMVKATR